jgi:NhaA family Na+:H+ antiporter
MGLHPWVAYLVMPIFALANAGVELETSSLSNSVAIAVAVALFVGKPLGILLFCYIAIALRFTRLPAGVSWPVFLGGACLGGIGFTMSLFLNALSFPTDEFPELEAAGKFGTLLGSLVSTILGSILLLVFLKPNRNQSELQSH